MRISDLNNIDKPREKALKLGINTLSDAELIAIILRTGTLSLSAIELGYELLKKYNGIVNFGRLNIDDLMNLKGIGESKALTLLAAIEISKRINYKTIIQSRINSIDDIFALLEPIISNEPQEKLFGIYLDTRQNVLGIDELFKGSLNFHSIHPRDIFREAIKHNSASFILVHNHPSGDPEPSKNDIDTTKHIDILSKQLGIPLIDHIIISKGSYFSMKSNKMI